MNIDKAEDALKYYRSWGCKKVSYSTAGNFHFGEPIEPIVLMRLFEAAHDGDDIAVECYNEYALHKKLPQFNNRLMWSSIAKLI